jgi:hypothetical protein
VLGHAGGTGNRVRKRRLWAVQLLTDGVTMQELNMTSLSDIGKFTGEDEPKERTSVQVLTGADPVGQLEHQLERRGSFNPLEGTPGVPASLSLGTSNRGDKSRSGPQIVIEGTSEEGSDSYDDVDPKQRRESKDSYILVRPGSSMVITANITAELVAYCCLTSKVMVYIPAWFP